MDKNKKKQNRKIIQNFNNKDCVGLDINSTRSFLNSTI